MTSLDGINGQSIQRLLKFKLGIYHEGLQMLTRAFKKEGQYSFLFQLKTPCGEGKKNSRPKHPAVGGGGKGVLPYISCRGMCRPKEYGFLHHSGLESGMVFEETAGVYEHINRFNSMAK